MNKVFRFRAKQGQSSKVCRLLTQHVGKPKVKSVGGVTTITVELPPNMSKRSVDRLLFAHQVPGAVSRRNKYTIIKGAEEYDVLYHRKADDGKVFIWVSKGKFMGKHEKYYHDFGCGPECCGGYFKLRKL